MWRPATKQITGTNEGTYIYRQFYTIGLKSSSVPLGARRRFGPAPAEDMAPPQLAQPSPSAYPRPPQQDDSPQRGRDESPVNGGGKLVELMTPAPPRRPLFGLDSSVTRLLPAHICICCRIYHLMPCANTDYDTNPNILLF